MRNDSLFPVFLQKTGVLIFLSILPLLLMIFWLFRVRFANAYKRRGPVVNLSEPSLSVR